MRLFLSLSLLLSVAYFTVAQTKLSSFPYLSSKEKGYIILLDGDSLHGEMRLKSLPNFIELQLETGEWERFYAGKIAYAVKETHIFAPIPFGKELSVGGSKRSIVEVIDTGYTKLYRYFSFGDARNSTALSKSNSFETYYILHKPGKEIVGLNGMAFTKFAKAIQPYFKDDSVLVQKIGTKGYKSKDDTPKIVAEYNAWKSVDLQAKKKAQQQQEEQEEQRQKEVLKKEIEEELRKQIEEELRKEMELKKDSL